MDFQSPSSFVITEIKAIKQSERRIQNPRKQIAAFRYHDSQTIISQVTTHTHYCKAVTKATHALLRMERLYWEPWLRTRGSLHDAATHAGRCSSIMRHFITERQPPWHQSSLRATYSTEGLPLWDSFWRKTCFCFLRA